MVQMFLSMSASWRLDASVSLLGGSCLPLHHPNYKSTYSPVRIGDKYPEVRGAISRGARQPPASDPARLGSVVLVALKAVRVV